ncbi:prolipoprotein diacylglyceryl transferase [Pseudoalteromonas shioyasakiensis]|jgi:phosphatidylglycerol:prolipoprotein diacylglycerol transferase|uniref:prolipoprotein diacylglyceryl transferase n=1 Tax=Pseudoalteromonas TaxID=53246 RepID=UPI000C599875|nr:MULTISPECIES: prolipoprotein diacylglyceryl transferase [Pseudoalteromonas]MAD01997.1 prolipoprotein diacylglyceryl transferase [Pseudoalteromonas sp.]MBD57252.1 prolipoprotein diacylglyceryl transferase [Pseudoalteromonas sp.]MCF2900359.1 prolipoprotein diacylglyceryl transferase [Pseudoalteromonas sp. OFAV1]MCG9710167.1 prolipoprotein diacylglyceryl transferase [Pseudoalteromonas sp. Isolate3]MCO7248599.1 prolipoprotein diacylglyceryl transferase [Pseudoalteromonas sp. Ps84H-4]|tara:strand:+ start:921 stop:1724 length:804 start_codon:yes stop_codon:yes gene_type:complete
MALQFPDIDPVIFSVGPLSVRWYGLMYLIGFALAMWLANRQAEKPNSGWTKEQVSDLLFYGMLGVILGGRIGYVLFYQFSYFIENPLYLFRIDQGGMSFHGGTLGVITAIAIFAWTRKKSLFEVGDFVVPLVPLGLLAGRIGNFINGELWGRVTDVPWAFIFPTGGPEPRHPSQLYEAFLEGLVLFLILQWFIKKPRPAGSVAGVFLLGYGVFRFIVEYFREPDAHLGLFAGVISMGQILSLPMVIGGLGLLIWAYKKPQHSVASKA